MNGNERALLLGLMAGAGTAVVFAVMRTPLAPTVTGTINGIATIGPLAPVAQPGVPNTRPAVGATIDFYEFVTYVIVARAIADAAGMFSVSVAPGSYNVVGGSAPFHAPTVFVVLHAGETAHITVAFDTGIR